ncbi:hypothetical protein niasHT_030328 [Heterodera trifolii]|uniref:Uncharacterized protein n=1 Tax=Heterodera trifolii TaxID=157864 RepID=A0ABD2KS96_9BILA
MSPNEKSDRPLQQPDNVQPVQQPHQQPDPEADLRAQIEDAEEDLLLNWWREDPTIVNESMAQFKKGWTFFVIPLTSTLDDSCGFELLRSGTTNVRATFNSPIPLGGVEMIVLGEFDQMIMVDYNRHIVTDSKLG